MFCRVLNAEHGANRVHHYFDPGFSVNLANNSNNAKKNTLLHRNRPYLDSTIINAIKSSTFDMVSYICHVFADIMSYYSLC